MFWYDHHDVGGWGWFAMSAGMVIFWAAIIAVGVLLFRALGRSSGQGSRKSTGWEAPGARPPAEQVLAERFARGEIDEEEYQRRLDTLHATHHPPPAR